MGNTESSVESSLSRSGSADPRRNHSQSPSTHRRTGSCRRIAERAPGEPFRRSKTCRAKDNRSASLTVLLMEKNSRKAVCMTTGLTLHQKALLTRKWNRMDKCTVYELGRQMFENVFRETPQYLSYIDLKDDPNWNNHINFKIHVQRFVSALVECMRRLREPSSACDILRDFGASYATNSKRVSAMYFERIANALNRAAAELQEGDHLDVEKNESRLEYGADTTVNSEWEKSQIFASTTTLSTCSSSIPMVRSTPRMSDLRRSLTSRHSESQMETLKEERIEHHRTHNCGGHDDKSLCPITADAWIVLSAFLANQIKLGYELERMIKNEMSKLGLEGLGLVGPTSVIEGGLGKRPVHA